ncbi:anti-sigma factor domain-containing protein [Sungkyunkwania multivorans]|uniref:Anti-sigma factor domain-containing protein n=1 Tax=Sungkyunkwania multivorans TaxID=1173618 RepID=A0ABW3CV47_9FLAO
MDIKEYIASGVLELYVAGSLSEKENQEVYELMMQHPEIKEEVEKIEQAILQITAAASPKATSGLQDTIREAALSTDAPKESQAPKVIPIASKKKTNWTSYTGWAASVLLAAGLFYFYQEKSNLESELQTTKFENNFLEQQIAEANNSLKSAQELVDILRDRNIVATKLDGQNVAPDSYATAFWNKETQTVYIDALGLPEPPAGKVYQVWSLKLDPLTPTSLGLLEDFVDDDNKVFTLANTNESQAFGITLEPAGGSESPTLEQLYTLGVVKS